MRSKNGEEAVAFMDDTLLLAQGKVLIDTNEWVKNMMTRSGGGLDWSASHQCEFSVDKFSIMGLMRRRESCPSPGPKTRPVQSCPNFLQGVKVPAVATHKFLGVMLDQELHWSMHLHYALQKGAKWVSIAGSPNHKGECHLST